jgi:lipid-A-disaccharide synthase
MERDLDLLLSIFPFEQDWYVGRVPRLAVEFVGHPILDRYPRAPCGGQRVDSLLAQSSTLPPPPVLSVLLLPGSRPAELQCHLPVMLGALELIRAKLPQTGAEMVLPNAALLTQAAALGLPRELRVQAGGLAEALRRSTIALAKTGTVTVECAFFGVPAVTLYRTSWSTYQVAKRKARVRWLTMPNLLAGEAVFPEFIQHAATPENIARAALELLTDGTRRREIKTKLAKVVASLGGPGASHRAADAIVKLLAGRRASPIGALAA